MNGPWRTEAVGRCLDRVTLPAVKLSTREYRQSGTYPVIDQGQALIAGWTNDPNAVIDEPLPVIVFGDHSRTFKYVDFPFARGADGTQVLKPRADIHPRFFYYACKALDLASRGYNRHFTLLKEKSIPIPDWAEQEHIADVLRVVEEYERHQAVQIDATRAVKRETLRVLFTRGLQGKTQQVTALGSFPSDWRVVKIGDLGRIVTGTTPPTKDRTNYAGGEIQFIAPGDFDHGDRIDVTEKKLTEVGLSISRPIPRDSTCFVCIGSTIGKVGVTTALESATNQQINSVIADGAYSARFVFHLLTYWSDWVKRHASPSPVPILSKGAFERIEIVTSVDLDEQRGIAAILDAIDDRILTLTQKHAVSSRLFDVLLHRLMRGEIRSDHLEVGQFPAFSAGAA
jgi:type I restriction enzyme S subunit